MRKPSAISENSKILPGKINNCLKPQVLELSCYPKVGIDIFFSNHPQLIMVFLITLTMVVAAVDTTLSPPSQLLNWHQDFHTLSQEYTGPIQISRTPTLAVLHAYIKVHPLSKHSDVAPLTVHNQHHPCWISDGIKFSSSYSLKGVLDQFEVAVHFRL